MVWWCGRDVGVGRCNSPILVGSGAVVLVFSEKKEQKSLCHLSYPVAYCPCSSLGGQLYHTAWAPRGNSDLRYNHVYLIAPSMSSRVCAFVCVAMHA